jgi:glyoxalase superfamily protein
MSLPVQVTFDADDPGTLAGFWAVALGYVEQPPPEGWDSWQAWAAERGIPRERWNNWAALVDPQQRGPRLLFIKVPEGKVAKNRVHLDVGAGAPDYDRTRIEAHVTRLVEAGGQVQRRVEEDDEFWVVMTDPEGNEFCVH